MADEDSKPKGVVNATLPGAQTESTFNYTRTGRYGEQYVINPLGSKMHLLADEGTYFTFANATPGTAIAGHAAPTDISTVVKAFFHLRMEESVASGKRLYMDFLALQQTVAGAGATDALWAAELDTGVTRVTSGGTAITEVNPNMASSSTASVTMTAGAVVTAAATTSNREIGAGVLRSVVGVIGDTYTWDFGSSDKKTTDMPMAGTAVANIVVPMPPVILGPTDQFLLHLHATSQSGAHSYQIRGGFWIR